MFQIAKRDDIKRQTADPLSVPNIKAEDNTFTVIEPPALPIPLETSACVYSTMKPK